MSNISGISIIVTSKVALFNFVSNLGWASMSFFVKKTKKKSKTEKKDFLSW